MRHECMTSWMIMLLHLKGIIGKMSLIAQEHSLGEALHSLIKDHIMFVKKDEFKLLNLLENMVALQPTTHGTSIEMSTEYTQEEVSSSKMGSGKEL
ncbi:hypothetical protein E3N88_34796 [Mikania micrantha]|uniref:Uncharacterized protein n=1 Tax=Mikania micrantha TaxID=192012 RepID=A0A5N6M010_9ASTR|nr:hypothetical protein E3N88_34796 [Mikania micrantha]